MKLAYDTLLSSVAFNFNLRRYTSAGAAASARPAAAAAAQGATLQFRPQVTTAKADEVAALNARVEELQAQAADVNAALAEAELAMHAAEREAPDDARKVRRCRFTASKPVLKAPVVSAISA